jgi:DNA-binding LytR/AlgR family response regulator
MNQLKCIIADDEPVARKILKEFIEQVPGLELAGQFENVAKTESWLQENKADILLLDIEMPRMSGMQYLKSFRIEPLVILTTAYPEYALEGYELNVIDYLLKPIAFNRFVKAIQKAKDYLELTEKPTKSANSSFMFVRSDRRIEKIELNQILFIESFGNYAYINTATKKIIAYLTLRSIESQLPEQEFIRVHKSYLINLSKIESIDDNQIRMNNHSIPVSRSHSEELMKMVQKRLLKR